MTNDKELIERLALSLAEKIGIDELESFAKLVAAEEREACAVAAWMAGMDEHNKARGMPCDAREVGSAGAQAIRMRSNAKLTGG